MIRNGFIALGLAAMAMTGCASVKVPLPGLERSSKPAVADPHQTRDVLSDAARQLAASAPVGASEGRGLSLVVFGGRDDAEKADAERYLATLADGDRLTLVMDDVDHVLSLAREVAEAGRPETNTRPGDYDVDLLEDAISDVQRARRVYVAALKHLRADGTPLTKAEIREVGDAFVQSARDIGVAADLVTARLKTPGAPQLATTPHLTEGGY